MSHFKFILAFPFLLALQSAVATPQLPVESTAIQQETSALTVDKFLLESFRTSKSSYYDQASEKFVITGKLIVHPGKFAPSERANLKILMETGQWTTAKGQPYDLRQAIMIFADGKGGPGDMMAYFFSDEFAQVTRDPFGINYPATPYVTGMSAGQFVEALVKSLGPEHSYLDGKTGAIVVPSLNLPLHDQDSTFCMEVVEIIVAGKIWISPSGVPYDFSKTTLTMPISELGTPEQRQKAKETRASLITNLYKYLEDAHSAKKQSHRTLFSTLNTSTEPLPNSILDRIKDIKFMKPSSCHGLLTADKTRTSSLRRQND